MPEKEPKAGLRCPPQLFGIYEDAVRIQASELRLESLPHAIMASFSTRNQAQEIDFEFEAGREMMDYLLNQPGVRKSGRGKVVIAYQEEAMPCLIEVEAARKGQERIRVSWRMSSTPKRAEQRRDVAGTQE
ncbi:MAG: hypothetical protein HYY24_23330 [Verrucomicrobia bacterium]|nr:hypothetical protein [Verrucomicrobiota bacterium]